MPTPRSPALSVRLDRVKLFLCDVDGVLTDASVFMGARGEFKQFNIVDGLGLKLLQREGIPVGWVSGRRSTATSQRARDLKIDYLAQVNGSKVAAIERILRQAGCTWQDACFVGDDLLDLGALRRVGLPVAVANAIAEVKAAAIYVTRARGGQGAIREVAELILKAQDRWERLIREFSE